MAKDLTSFQTAHQSFVSYLKKKKRSISTILAYRNDLKQFGEILSVAQVDKVTMIMPQHIESFKNNLAEKKYTAKSVSRKLNSIRTFFRFLREEKVIEQDPSAEIAPPHYDLKKPRILSRTEYGALRDAARTDPRISAIIEILLQTGVRIGELTRIELKHLKGETVLIVPYESHEDREVPLNQSAQKAIEDYLKNRPRTRCKNLFVTKSGRPLLVRNVRSIIMRYFQMAGIREARVNDLRHTFIAHQLLNGTPVVILQKIVGHKRISTTEKYLEFAGIIEPDKMKVEDL